MGVLAPGSPQPSSPGGWHEEESEEKGISARVGGLRSNQGSLKEFTFLSWPCRKETHSLGLKLFTSVGKFISTLVLQWQGGIIPILHMQSWGTVRLGLYGPFNMVVHVAMPLAHLQSLVKYICNICMVSMATDTALHAYFCCKLQQKLIFGTQIARRMLPLLQKIMITSAKFGLNGDLNFFFFIFIGAWGTSRVKSQLCMCARPLSPLAVFPVIH